MNFIPWTFEASGLYLGVIHNAYLSIFAETGLMGFIPMMTLMALTWGDFGRSFTLARRMGPLTRAPHRGSCAAGHRSFRNV